MTSVPSPGLRANSVYVVAPPNGYPVVPESMPQVPLYPNNQTQIHVIPGNLPVSVPTQKVLKNGKVLGAIQILIGLVHIGMGSIMLTNLFGYYVPVSLYGGFPFWGAIWFIISGSLSVAAENQPNSPCLMNGSVGLNIFSAICSAVGVILFITDMSVSGANVHHSDYPYYDNWNTGMAISGVLLIFCLLEFCIASVSSHFGCQVTCCQQNNVL
ncbi:membrane-spanning 4-domains subfamily A member 8 isoform X2 [Mesocricetus auratus]|uniref:Membrane-spanning 4-domains subfamily A member 8 isoform X2 n=1 Tax=Mesocricetus auratus TaxID=10036 RepID=A0ABM2XKR4_MESAU|nr:membrane-spanning 4-domains subfamily A member 8 isoform X2 [Mesocricetus auratus]